MTAGVFLPIPRADSRVWRVVHALASIATIPMGMGVSASLWPVNPIAAVVVAIWAVQSAWLAAGVALFGHWPVFPRAATPEADDA